eukprot:gene57118-biopygen38950
MGRVGKGWEGLGKVGKGWSDKCFAETILDPVGLPLHIQHSKSSQSAHPPRGGAAGATAGKARGRMALGGGHAAMLRSCAGVGRPRTTSASGVSRKQAGAGEFLQSFVRTNYLLELKKLLKGLARGYAPSTVNPPEDSSCLWATPGDMLQFPPNSDPNNPEQPLLLYRGVAPPTKEPDPAGLLTKHGWTRPWSWQIFDYHHYHTTA